MRLDFDVFGERQVSRRLLRVSAAAANASPAFNRIVDRLEEISEEQFDTQGSRAQAWPPLAQTTLARKRALGLDHRILHATGALRESLTGGEGGQRIVTDDFLVFGTTLEYAGVHHKGGNVIPQRRVIDLTERDRKEMVRTLQRWMMTGQLA